jgi:GAF domain-containing protein
MDASRAARYERIYEQLRDLIVGHSPDRIAAMATICAVLHAKMRHHFWTGFYLHDGEGVLRVGPYQGPVACQRLSGRGVCLQVATTGKPVVVEDVHAFPGHIACDPRSQSEIVVPLIVEGEVAAVLDVDAAERGQFSDDDIEPLSRIVALLDSIPR